MRITIVGAGRAGGSFAAALRRVGHDVDLLGRHADLDVVGDTDVVLLAVPDRAIAEVAVAIPSGEAVVLHCSGATTLEPLAHHHRHGSLHPLMTLPDPERGAQRLLDGCTFAVAGDTVAGSLADDLGGHVIEIDDERRATYHAAAVIASNHTVALAGQVARLADQLGLPADAFWGLLRAAVDSIVELGPDAALTGPAARGDTGTIQAHLAALPTDEHEAYLALSRQAARLAGRSLDLDPDADGGRLGP